MLDSDAVLKKRVFHLLNNGKLDGIWTPLNGSYAFSSFSIDNGVLSCTRYQIHKDNESFFQGLDNYSINSPFENYQICGVKGISGDLDGNRVTIVIVDSKTRMDLDIPDDHDLILDYYPALSKKLHVTM